MIIDCISDCHGHYPKLEGGDLLIVAGDLTNNDTFDAHIEFNRWLYAQKYKKIIVIAGNHDNHLIKQEPSKFYYSSWNSVTGEQKSYAEYLCDSGTEFEYEEIVGFPSEYMRPRKTVAHEKKKLKIWGSPWTLRFEGMNPQAMAFTVDTEEELAEKWALIPDDVSILVTHSPPRSVLDWNNAGDNFGSTSLLMRATSLSNLKLFVFGHIHEAYGLYNPKDLIEFEQKNKHIFGPSKCKSMPYIVNASHVNERYEPVNNPIRITL